MTQVSKTKTQPSAFLDELQVDSLETRFQEDPIRSLGLAKETEEAQARYETKSRQLDPHAERVKESQVAGVENGLVGVETGVHTNALSSEVAGSTVLVAGKGLDLWNNDAALEGRLDQVEVTQKLVKDLNLPYANLPDFWNGIETGNAPFLYLEEDEVKTVGLFSDKNEDGNVVRKGLISKLFSNFKEPSVFGVFPWLANSFRKSIADVGIWFGLRNSLEKINEGYQSSKVLEAEVQGQVDEYSAVYQDGEKAIKKAGSLRDQKQTLERVDGGVTMEMARRSFKNLIFKGPKLIAQASTGAVGGANPSKFFVRESGMETLKAYYEKDKKGFAQVAKEFGVKAHGIRMTSFYTTLGLLAFDSIFRPEKLEGESLTSEVGDALYGLIPFTWASGEAWDDIQSLSGWTKTGVIAANLGLDVVSVLGIGASLFTGGTSAVGAAAGVAAGRGALGVGGRVATKQAAKKAAGSQALKLTGNYKGLSPKAFMQKIPKPSKEALMAFARPGAIKTAGLSTGLLIGFDYLMSNFDEKQAVMDFAENRIRDDYEELSRQQQRAIEMMNLDLDQVLQKAQENIEEPSS